MRVRPAGDRKRPVVAAAGEGGNDDRGDREGGQEHRDPPEGSAVSLGAMSVSVVAVMGLPPSSGPTVTTAACGSSTAIVECCRRSADGGPEAGGVERRSCPTVKITEPGRTPLQLVIRRPVDVGRDCDGLLLADPELSRLHLRLSATAGRLFVTDVGSTNGTRLDGAELAGPTRVSPGQVVTFGHCRLELVEHGRAPSVAADPLRRTSIDIVADAAVADPMAPGLFGGGTLTIVFSDIEQSTRRSEELGDVAWVRLLGLHNNIVRRHLERHGGHEVKAQGDGFMLAFPSAAPPCCARSTSSARSTPTVGRSPPTCFG